MWQITIIQDGKKVSSLPVEYEPSCVTINQESGDVAVGGTADNKVHHCINVSLLSLSALSNEYYYVKLGPHI